MTCIIGIEYDGGVLLAADTQASGGWDCTTRADPKLYRLNDHVAIGFTSSYRMGQILGYSLDLRSVVGPEDTNWDTVHRWMVTTFIEQARNALRNGGIVRTNNGVESGGTYLVAAYSRLFQVHDDFQVASPLDGIDACGCGYAYALGAMNTLPNADPEARAHAGMAAAMKFSNGVGGSTQIIDVKAA